uniref:Uncharacterized protein n=1 Tax=Ignisphaera aggregans TaxID=334771 RepID=A0A7C4FHK6_9CREN
MGMNRGIMAIVIATLAVLVAVPYYATVSTRIAIAPYSQMPTVIIVFNLAILKAHGSRAILIYLTLHQKGSADI